MVVLVTVWSVIKFSKSTEIFTFTKMILTGFSRNKPTCMNGSASHLSYVLDNALPFDVLCDGVIHHNGLISQEHQLARKKTLMSGHSSAYLDFF